MSEKLFYSDILYLNKDSEIKNNHKLMYYTIFLQNILTAHKNTYHLMELCI